MGGHVEEETVMWNEQLMRQQANIPTLSLEILRVGFFSVCWLCRCLNLAFGIHGICGLVYDVGAFGGLH